MNRIIIASLMAAAAALAGCDQETITPQGPYDPNANLTNNSGPIKLPPAITASKAYRCKDNSLVYVDWYADGTARLKATRTEVGVLVKAEDLKGDSKSTSITASGKTCHV